MEDERHDEGSFRMLDPHGLDFFLGALVLISRIFPHFFSLSIFPIKYTSEVCYLLFYYAPSLLHSSFPSLLKRRQQILHRKTLHTTSTTMSSSKGSTSLLHFPFWRLDSSTSSPRLAPMPLKLGTILCLAIHIIASVQQGRFPRK